MTHKLYLTHKGRDKITALATTGQGRPLTISHFAVGSGKNVDFSRRLSQTTLVQQRGQFLTVGHATYSVWRFAIVDSITDGTPTPAKCYPQGQSLPNGLPVSSGIATRR